jgi:hypothetical protein
MFQAAQAEERARKALTSQELAKEASGMEVTSVPATSFRTGGITEAA